ncbi:hypothetical protein VDGL01_03985 [Verticillium dahliae]
MVLSKCQAAIDGVGANAQCLYVGGQTRQSAAWVLLSLTGGAAAPAAPAAPVAPAAHTTAGAGAGAPSLIPT